MDTEFAYLNHGNTIDLVLMANGAVPSLTGVTRMVLEMASGVSVDSDDTPAAFDWTQTVSAEEGALPQAQAAGIAAGDPKLVIKPEGLTITAGTYNARLIVYDASHLTGIVWGRIRIVVE